AEMPANRALWAVSSVGRAPARQAGGHWFEPSTAHQNCLTQTRGLFGAPGSLKDASQVAQSISGACGLPEVHLRSVRGAATRDRDLSLRPYVGRLHPERGAASALALGSLSFRTRLHFRASPRNAKGEGRLHSPESGGMGYSPQAREIMRRAQNAATRYGQSDVCAEH